MKILNLVDKSKSDINYTISKFPDGQQNLTIDKDSVLFYWQAKVIEKHMQSSVRAPEDVEICTRLNNFLDLEILICAVKSLRNIGIERISLYAPYFMGARSDRLFEAGGNNYLKDVVCPIINSLSFYKVTVIDPHSDVLEACLNNFQKVSNLELVKWATREMFGVISEKGPDSKYPCLLVSPDAGAVKKIHKVAEQIGYYGDVVICSKERDTQGKLNKVSIFYPTHKYEGQDFVIIDDICDGGATFINIARKLREMMDIRKANQQITPGKIYLIVTHGIFSKGFFDLKYYLNGIYCTNSYANLERQAMYNGHKIPENFIHQLDVFSIKDEIC